MLPSLSKFCHGLTHLRIAALVVETYICSRPNPVTRSRDFRAF